MNKQTEALKMAIEWVEGWKGIAPSKIELLRVLREALEHKTRIWECEGYNSLCQQLEIAEKKIEKLKAEQPAQEPVAWMYRVNNTYTQFDTEKPPSDAYDDGTLIPLYTKEQL